jgi:hypothetical protein
MKEIRKATVSSGGGKPKGYTFSVHVTKTHAREAVEAQRRKTPSRFGKLVLKLLGFKGEVGSDYVE